MWQKLYALCFVILGLVPNYFTGKLADSLLDYNNQKYRISEGTKLFERKKEQFSRE